MGKSDPDHSARPKRVQITVAELLGGRSIVARHHRARQPSCIADQPSSRRAWTAVGGCAVAVGTIAAALLVQPDQSGRSDAHRGVPSPGSRTPEVGVPHGGISELPQPGSAPPPVPPSLLPGEHNLLLRPPPGSAPAMLVVPEPVDAPRWGARSRASTAQPSQRLPGARPESTSEPDTAEGPGRLTGPLNLRLADVSETAATAASGSTGSHAGSALSSLTEPITALDAG